MFNTDKISIIVGKESSIINFIRDNLKLLQQKEFPDELYKKIKHEYFIQIKNIIGKPKDTEIAKIATSYMISKNLIKDEAKLNQFLELPFFKKNLYDTNIFFEELKLKNPNYITIIDPAKMESTEYVEQLEEKIKDKLITENQFMIDEQSKQLQLDIEQKKKELASIPSRLDEEEIIEPVIVKSEKEQLEWWQTLNLKEDPIPIQEGFQKINVEYYEDIVVHTDIFDRYVNYGKNLPDQIFKNTIFYGDFGSGKTTFFDYLKQTLLRNKILLIYVQIWASLDSEKIILDFKTDLISALIIECKKFGGNVDEFQNENYDQIIRTLLNELHKNHNFTGFVIVVDDLHKNDKAFNAVVLFLNSLQIFVAKLTRGNTFNLTAYVAGKPQWKDRIKSEPSLSGSLIRDEMMPEITEQNAFDMLNNRMLAFSINPDKKNIIGRAFVKEIYDDLKNNNKTITFRTFLQKSIDEFRMGNFDRVVTINPRAINKDIIKDIKSIIKNSSKLSTQIDQLFSLIQNVHEENKQKCFEFLGTIYLEKKFHEQESSGDRNVWVLKQLRQSGLIINFKDEKGVFWSISRELRTVNQEIIDKYNVSMEEYLVPTYFSTIVTRKRIISSPELKDLTEILKNRNDNNDKLIIQKVIADYEPFLEIYENKVINISPNDLVEKCLTILASITNAFMFLQSIPKINGSNLQIISFWKNFWYKPSLMIEFIDQIESNREIDASVANYIFSICRDAISETISFLKDQIEKDRIFELSYNNLTNEDCKTIDMCREDWLNNNYFEMCKKITEYLEKKIRVNVFNIFTLFYGEQEFRYHRYADEVIKVMKSKTSVDQKRGMSKISNELQFLDRGEYKMLMTKNTSENPSPSGEKNWNDVFKDIFIPWSQDDLLKFLNKFGDFNLSVSHNKTESIGKKNQPDLRTYLMDSITFIQRLNGVYEMILKNGVKKINLKYYFGFKHKLDTLSIMDISPKKERTRELIKILKLMEEINVNMEQPKFLESLYNTDYREFVLIIYWLLNATPDEKTQLGSSLVILNDKSPNFIFKLIKN